MSLTNKRHIKFVEHYMSNGMNATQAYLSTYPNVTEETANVNGSRLLSNAKVKVAIELLQAETSKELKVTKESLIKDLIAIKDLCKDNTKVTHNSIKAIEVINKMLGYNEPDKIESSNINTNITLSELIDFEDDEE